MSNKKRNYLCFVKCIVVKKLESVFQPFSLRLSGNARSTDKQLKH